MQDNLLSDNETYCACLRQQPHQKEKRKLDWSSYGNINEYINIMHQYYVTEISNMENLCNNIERTVIVLSKHLQDVSPRCNNHHVNLYAKLLLA